jgi:diguanylate cyclase (GGDEF)-like protein
VTWAENSFLVAWGGAAVLSLRFRQGRVFLATLALATVVLFYWSGLAWPQWLRAHVAALGQGFALVLPLMLASISVLAECRPWGRRGAYRLSWFLLLSVALAAVVAGAPGWIGRSGEDALIWPGVGVPWGAVPGLAFGLPLAAILALSQPHPLRRAFFWASGTALLPFFVAGSLWHYAGLALILAAACVEAAYNLAFTDALTGLPSRRRLEEELGDLPRQFCIAMVDVDRFKGVNDRYGHDVGDQVLAMVARHLRRVAGGGRAYRYGGEEFVILFPGLQVARAEPLADEVRKRIAESPFVLRAADRPAKKPSASARGRSRSTRQIRVTVSIGLAGPTPRYQTPSQALRRADQALYRAKKKGRNRVCR